MRAIASWLAQKGLLYLALCLAIAFFLLAWPSLRSQFADGSLGQETMSVEQVRAELGRFRAGRQQQVEAGATQMRSASRAALEQRLTEANRDLAARRAEATQTGLFDSWRPSRILASRKRAVEVSALEVEIAALTAALDAKRREDALRQATARLGQFPPIPTAAAVEASLRQCRTAERQLADFDARYDVDRAIREAVLGQRSSLAERQSELCNAAERRQSLRNNGLAARQQAAAARALAEQARNWRVGEIADGSQGLGSHTLRDILVLAAIALLLILLMPLLIRLVFWFVLAPLAQRRATIRLPGAGAGANQPALLRASASSVAIELRPGEELLVKPGYLQALPREAGKADQLLLDWRYPFASFASGMRLLTRIRGDGSTTTVSATHDPIAEVALIELPEGGACVLQPRALAAVAQPQGRAMRISSHWRLFSLNAWLTWQLRFLVFHGPARLVLRGSRGVRVEQAGQGRDFGSDQLVGFSTELAYSIARYPTPLPYFLGQVPLFQDRVHAGAGVVILEEAPLAGRDGRSGKRGLEGMIDAALKAFGI